MKKGHYQFIGYPRTGSTFLHRIFRETNKFGTCARSVFKETVVKTSEEYEKLYSEFDYSINMFTGLIVEDANTIKVAGEVTDKFFACMRNPYECNQSQYTYHDGTWPLKIESLNYSHYISRFQNLVSAPVKIFIFDDLVEKQNEFVDSVFDYLNCDRPAVDLSKILRNESSMTRYNSKTRTTELRTTNSKLATYNYSQEEITEINSYIDNFSVFMDRDFSHWKR